MGRSKFSNYKRGVKYFLLTRCDWSSERADEWIKHKNTFLWEMWSNNIPRRESVKYLIDEVAKEDLNSGNK